MKYRIQFELPMIPKGSIIEVFDDTEYQGKIDFLIRPVEIAGIVFPKIVQNCLGYWFKQYPQLFEEVKE